MMIGARRILRFAGVAATLWISLACVAAVPVMRQFTRQTATSDAKQPWAAVEIPKASLTPTLTPQLATSMTPTPTSVMEPTAIAIPRSDATAEPPVITMVIVDSTSPSTAPQDTKAAPGSDGKYIVVSIGEQHLYAYENGRLVYSFVASTGLGNSTRVGAFHVLDKIPSAYGANWNIWMPNWLGIYWSGTLENGIHALPILPGGGRLWAGYLGAPISYGCVVLGVDESLQLYNWAEVGTPVEIRW